MIQNLAKAAAALMLLATAAAQSHAQSMACAALNVLSTIESEGFSSYYEYLEPIDDTTVIAAWADEIRIFDCSTPDIVEIGSHVFKDNADEFMRAGQYMFRTDYIANADSLLYIYDATQPASPIKIATISIPKGFDKVVIANDHLYAYRRTFRSMDIFDFTTPTAPMLVNSLEFKSAIYGLDAINDQTLLLADGNRELQAFDLTDPANPIHVSTFDDFTYSGFWSISVLKAYGNLALTNDGCDDLLVIDYTDPAAPIEIGSEPFLSCPRDLIIDDSTAFVTHSNGFTLLNLSTPTNPSTHKHTQTRPYFGTMAVTDNRIFTSTTKRPIAVLDKQDELGRRTTQQFSNDPGNYRAIVVVGNRCYAATSLGFLTTTDITDPFNPVLLSTSFTTAPARDIVVHNAYAYVAFGTGFDVFSLADPDNPQWIRFVDDVHVNNLVAEDDLLVTTTSEPSGLTVFSLSDPANPQIYAANAGPVPEYLTDMVIRDKTVYAAGGYNTLVLIDVSDPTNPTITDDYDAPGFVEFSTAIALDGPLAYVGTDWGYLYIVDISDPNNITLVDSHFLAPEIRTLGIGDNRLAMGINGMHLYDLADPTNPQYLSSEWSYAAYSPQIHNGVFYAGASNLGLWTANISDCTTCLADLNGDYTHNFYDVSLFLGFYNAQNPKADFQPDGVINFFDVSAFIDAYQAGCP